MTERARSQADPHEQLPSNEPVLPIDEFWEELIRQELRLDPELLKKAREYVQGKYDTTYWDDVRREVENFWARRYDPNASEDW